MKYNTCIVFGGASVEHEVSIITASQLMENMDKDKYVPFPLYITKNNELYYSGEMNDINFFKVDDLSQIETKAKPVQLMRQGRHVTLYEVKASRLKAITVVDLAILSVHGTQCEDGTVSALFDLLNLPYVGSGVLASSISQNKGMTKVLLEKSGLPVIPYTYFYKNDLLNKEEEVYASCEALAYPLIVKPASLGSSVGIKICESLEELKEGIHVALRYDDCILVEKAIRQMKEYNCAVLGNRNNQRPSLVEEVLKKEEILSYEDKYLSGGKGSKGMASTKRIIPAELSDLEQQKVQDLAVQTVRVLGNSGVSRIDFIYDEEDTTFYINEINTIPGSFAYYLWDSTQLSFTDLIDELVKIALEDYKQKENTTFTYDTNILSFSQSNISKLK